VRETVIRALFQFVPLFVALRIGVWLTLTYRRTRPWAMLLAVVASTIALLTLMIISLLWWIGVPPREFRGHPGVLLAWVVLLLALFAAFRPIPDVAGADASLSSDRPRGGVPHDVRVGAITRGRRSLVALLGLVGALGLCLALGLLVSLLEGWADPSSPVDAGREWFVPKNSLGRPDRAIPDYARVLAEQEVNHRQRLVLYAWRTSATAPSDALAVTPLGIQRTSFLDLPWEPRTSGWRPAGVAGPQAALPRGEDFWAGSFPAGFGGLDEAMAAAWGLSARGSGVRVTWSDGAVTEAPLREGAFLQLRPDPAYRADPPRRLRARRMELLDGAGTVLATRDLPGAAQPEVSGP
jgi:hypothetical protein